MNTQFRTLFTLAISHSYYQASCKDFAFFIPAYTAQLLRNGKLLTKVHDGKLYVLLETDEVGVALNPLEGKSLRFGLKLLNPFFSNITDYNFNSNTPLYRNATEPTRLDSAKEIKLVGRIFSHKISDTETRPVTVTLQTTNGQILQKDTIKDKEIASVSYDITGQASDIYTVAESYLSTSKAITYYLDSELVSKSIFCVIDIKLDNSIYINTPDKPEFTKFEIVFTAKQETLKYYLVVRNYSDKDFNQLAVVDKGFTEDGRSQINFTKVNPVDFARDDISPALLDNGDARVVLFKSQGVVNRQENARKKIQVLKNGDELIKHLPQPGADKVNSDLIIQLSKT